MFKSILHTYGKLLVSVYNQTNSLVNKVSDPVMAKLGELVDKPEVAQSIRLRRELGVTPAQAAFTLFCWLLNKASNSEVVQQEAAKYDAFAHEVFTRTITKATEGLVPKKDSSFFKQNPCIFCGVECRSFLLVRGYDFAAGRYYEPGSSVCSSDACIARRDITFNDDPVH